MTGPLYCCIFMAQRRTDWRLKPLRGSATSSPDSTLQMKSNTLGSISVRLVAPVSSPKSDLCGLPLSAFLRVNIGPVYRKASHYFTDRTPQDVVREVGVRGFSVATRAASRASTFNSLAISFRMIRSLEFRTTSAKLLRSPVNST